MKWAAIHQTSMQCSLSLATVIELLINYNLKPITLDEYYFIISNLIITDPSNYIPV